MSELFKFNFALRVLQIDYSDCIVLCTCIIMIPCAGSSAGAGSEVFHVYRHLRRRENDRQAIISENADVEDREMEFQEKVLANKLADDEKTSKKRAKR